MRIKACKRGPLLVEGEVELFDVHGKQLDVTGRRTLLLCRCGASKSSPLCDGSHNRIGFQPAHELQSQSELPTEGDA